MECNCTNSNKSNSKHPNKDIGNIYWKFKTGGKIYGSPVIDDEGIYIGSNNGTLYALNKKSGTEKWQYNIGAVADLRGRPIIQGQNIYFSGYDRKVHGVNIKNGKQAWTFKAGGQIYSSPTVADGILYVGSNNGILYAIAAEPLQVENIK